ncbi:hypothetical protein [Actinoplanes subtropicus]|uniref:hypothetical protein n=1 Tax=Actinoplanes subtropicus TaxID=543632 RepID=UPI0012F892DE
MTEDQEHDYLAYASGRIPALRRLAILLCGDDDQADDLVQETITKLYAVWRSSSPGRVDSRCREAARTVPAIRCPRRRWTDAGSGPGARSLR